jgi:hypothetical protein
MKRIRRRKDTISEEAYTRGMSMLPSSPEDDSPGDSESDVDSEFLMGMSYEPEVSSGLDDELDDDSTSESADDPEVDPLAPPSTSTKKATRVEDQIPESARVISSEAPGPRFDSEEPTNVH